MRLRIALAMAGALAAIAVAAPGAFGDPTHAKNSFSFDATCNGQKVMLVVNSANGQGKGAQKNDTAPFAPAHVIGSTKVFHPTKFDLTFSFSFGGQTQSFLDTDTMKHARTPVTCSISGSQSSPQGTFSINGTAWGYFT